MTSSVSAASKRSSVTRKSGEVGIKYLRQYMKRRTVILSLMVSKTIDGARSTLVQNIKPMIIVSGKWEVFHPKSNFWPCTFPSFCAFCYYFSLLYLFFFFFWLFTNILCLVNHVPLSLWDQTLYLYPLVLSLGARIFAYLAILQPSEKNTGKVKQICLCRRNSESLHIQALSTFLCYSKWIYYFKIIDITRTNFLQILKKTKLS